MSVIFVEHHFKYAPVLKLLFDVAVKMRHFIKIIIVSLNFY